MEQMKVKKNVYSYRAQEVYSTKKLLKKNNYFVLCKNLPFFY